MKRLSIAIFVFVCFTNLFPQTYYVSSSNGNDNNSGLSATSPWKTTAKVNSKTFKPGDNILFKKGDIWLGEQLVIDHSGIVDNPIRYSSYGTGLKPIITLYDSVPNAMNGSNWTATGYTNVWLMKLCNGYTTPHYITRLWLSGVEYLIAAGLTADNANGTFGVNATNRFYFSRTNGTLYVYALSNPASYYSSIECAGEISSTGAGARHTIELKDADYITIDGLDVQGALKMSIGLAGSDYVTIKNCNVGKYAQWGGIYGQSDYISSTDKTSDYVTIESDTIYSDFNLIQQLQFSDASGIQYGIAIDAATGWEVYQHIIKYMITNKLVQ